MSEPRRVLFLNDTARNGGPGRSLQTILCNLDPGRFHRTVVLPREDVIAQELRRNRCVENLVIAKDLLENPFQPVERPIEREDLQAPWWLRGVRLGVNVGRTLRLGRTLPRLARSLGAELVYCNGTTADFLGALLARSLGVPALWHVRYTSVPPALVGLHQRLARGPTVARIVCVSHAAAALFPTLEAKVRVVHNAVDTERFKKGVVRGCLRGAVVPEDAYVFGSMGRILPRKGYPELLRATREALDLATEDERRRLRVVIVGDTPSDAPGDHLAECLALARELRLEGHVLFPGFAPDVRPYLEDFDVVVLPSVYADPLPRTVLEGMAFGLPVVAFAVGGVAEMVEPGVTGALLAPSSSPRAFGEVLLSYLRDRDKVHREGARARAAVEEHFDARAHGRAIGAQILEALGP
ncbi:MAG: glycosyltransferase family 4 protein [Deltaproteobacteria bacterium]|nr:glycosyltransferase family 4 protein [Deltaproteobacteria bacterium]